ncbi:MAG TPA: hypothetical protein EYP23_00055 [Thermoplasmata archaeon]|nr:hypothetical protein [Thermoplasmata archaeon]
MSDDLDILGVAPSDRKKLESMGITRIEQIALLTHQQLGMGRSKGEHLIRRAHNILASRNIEDITIGEREVEVEVKTLDRAVKRAVLSVLGVYGVSPGVVSVSEKGKTIIIFRRTPAFTHVVEQAEIQKGLLIRRRKEEMEKKGVSLPLEEIKDFAEQRGFEGFWRNVFSEIKCNELMKKAISASLFSTFDEPVHTLIVGEPGSSKTLAKEIVESSFSGISIIGANTTRAGLVCHLGTGDLGALPHANNKVVLVDEFDKIPESDIEYCYELLSNGRCSVHSSRLHTEITSRFIMLAFANPRKGVFHGKPLYNISLPPLLVSRFALVVKTENISEDERKQLFKEKFFGGSEIRQKPKYYDQWVKQARIHQPEIDVLEERIERYIEKASRIVDEYQATSLRRDLRMGDYIRRIPFAIARASFGNVTREVLEESELLIEESVENWKK